MASGTSSPFPLTSKPLFDSPWIIFALSLHWLLLSLSAAALEEQPEKLRRVVDAWRCRSNELLKNLSADDPYGSLSTLDLGSSNSDPIHVSAEPTEHKDVLTLVQSDNVSVSKLITVLSYDCNEISRLCRYVRLSLLFSQSPPSFYQTVREV